MTTAEALDERRNKGILVPVSVSEKEAFLRVAHAERREMADIARQAFSEYMERHGHDPLPKLRNQRGRPRNQSN